jgi:hypothetical protein
MVLKKYLCIEYRYTDMGMVEKFIEFTDKGQGQKLTGAQSPMAP